MGKKLQPLVVEIRRITEKIFTSGNAFSVGSNSSFWARSILPTRNLNYNFLGTGIDVYFNYHNPIKRTPIPLTYQDLTSEETYENIILNKREVSIYLEDSTGISLVFPHKYIEQITRTQPENNEIFTFDVSKIEAEFSHAEDRGYAEIICHGKFTKPVFVFDSKPVKEVDKVIFRIISGDKSVELPFTNEYKGEIGNYRMILFEEKFEKGSDKGIMLIYD